VAYTINTSYNKSLFSSCQRHLNDRFSYGTLTIETVIDGTLAMNDGTLMSADGTQTVDGHLNNR
jgi:hypothetical protein